MQEYIKKKKPQEVKKPEKVNSKGGKADLTRRSSSTNVEELLKEAEKVLEKSPTRPCGC